ncbi:hypothetical protein SAMN05216330_11864 [Bradyrhizobium sp. Ghvi]|nr:hypothetical protein SAMN05216330_11864 [Bradyrhizobium sp. Ghvi]
MLGSHTQARCQSLDDRVLQYPVLRAGANVRHQVGDLPGHGDQGSDEHVRINTRLARKFLPLAQADLNELVFNPDFHCEFNLALIEIFIRKNAGDVVKGGETHERTAVQKQ